MLDENLQMILSQANGRFFYDIKYCASRHIHTIYDGCVQWIHVQGRIYTRVYPGLCPDLCPGKFMI